MQNAYEYVKTPELRDKNKVEAVFWVTLLSTPSKHFCSKTARRSAVPKASGSDARYVL